MVKKIATVKNPAYMLTKAISVLKFKHCLDRLGFCSLLLPLGDGGDLMRRFKLGT
jgi:hypothetical protein